MTVWIVNEGTVEDLDSVEQLPPADTFGRDWIVVAADDAAGAELLAIAHDRDEISPHDLLNAAIGCGVSDTAALVLHLTPETDYERIERRVFDAMADRTREEYWPHDDAHAVWVYATETLGIELSQAACERIAARIADLVSEDK